MRVFRQLGLSAIFLLLALSGLFQLEAETLQEEDINRALSRLQHFEGIQDWEIVASDHSITLTSHFKIEVSDSRAIATVADSNIDASANTIEPEAKSSPFHITLHFLPFDSYEQLNELQKTRNQLTEILNRDAFDFEGEALTEAQWNEAWGNLQKHPLPTHVAGDSLVYFTSDLDNPDLSFEPSESLKTCIWMQYRLGFLFSEIVR